MGKARVTIPYAPRAAFRAFHARSQRFSVGVAHRRAGKTVAHINDLIRAALKCKREAPRFGYLAPSFAQAKDIAWEYLKKFTAPIPGVQQHESELRVDLPNGGRVRLYGAENAERLRGLYFDGVVLDEYAQMRPGVWSEIVRPSLSDRNGWASFIGTPMGKNQFWEIFQRAKSDPDWFTFVLKASETGLIGAMELEAARADMTQEQYDQEYECSFEAALVGAYFGREIAQAERDGRITGVPYDPAAKVETWWDLGMDDSTAIWFVQQVGREMRVIDYYEANGENLAHYAGVLGKKPYVYGEHVLPHDAEVRELGTGLSRVATLKSLGIGRVKIMPASNPEDRVNAVRMTLPKCWFDAVKCAPGLESLRQYRREWNDKLKSFKSSPLHDWSSHAADAFGYGCTKRRDHDRDIRRPAYANSDYDVPVGWSGERPQYAESD